MEKNSTIMEMIVKGLEKIGLAEMFEKDEYESRRKAMPGERLVKIMVVYQLIKSRYMRGLVRAIENSANLQKAVGGEIALNTLSNALAQRPIEEMMAAWQLVIKEYGEKIDKVGKKFARLALIDSSLIKLSLAAFDWADYRKAKGAIKMHMVLEWGRQIPQQLQITTGRFNDLNPSVKVDWQVGWTYVQDRGYLCFIRLKSILEAGAHFVVRVKANTDFQIIERREVDRSKQPSGICLTSDWTIRLAGWPDKLLRLVSYQLPDATLVRVLTDRFDLTALNIAQLYKERWKIENWWKWVKSVFKIKEPIARNLNGVQSQIITALIADLLLRFFKHLGNFSGSLYDFVVLCQELSFLSLSDISAGSFRSALHLIHLYFFQLNFATPDPYFSYGTGLMANKVNMTNLFDVAYSDIINNKQQLYSTLKTIEPVYSDLTEEQQLLLDWYIKTINKNFDWVTNSFNIKMISNEYLSWIYLWLAIYHFEKNDIQMVMFNISMAQQYCDYVDYKTREFIEAEIQLLKAEIMIYYQKYNDAIQNLQSLAHSKFIKVAQNAKNWVTPLTTNQKIGNYIFSSPCRDRSFLERK